MKRDIWIFLMFLFLATMMWYGHAMQSVRNTNVPVSVHYTGKPGPIGLGEEGSPETVMIEVRDAGARLNTYHREPLRLTIDLRPYIHGDKGTIHIPSDVLRRSISDILQGTSKLVDTHPEEISCTYFTEQEKTVPLAFKGTIVPADEYQTVGVPVLAHKRVKIYGQDKALNAIDTLYTADLEWKDITDTVTCTIPLAVPKGMRAEYDSIEVRVVTERFTEKKMLIPLKVLNAPQGYRIRLFPKEVEVNVRVGMAHFAKVQPSDITATCTYSPDRKETMDVEIRRCV